MNQYFLQCESLNPAQLGIWEEVSQYIYDNWDKVIILDEITNEEKPRYTGNRIKLEKGGYFIDCEQGLDSDDLLLVAKICNLKTSQTIQPIPGGWIRSPDTVRLKYRNRLALHEIKTGENFYPKKEKVATQLPQTTQNVT